MKAKMEASGMERESRRAVAVLDGGVHKKANKKNKTGSVAVNGKKAEENAEEMKEYLGKLQELVPFMPKNKRLSKLEVISNVIDYIDYLRETLGMPPCQQTECQSYDILANDDDAIMEDHQTDLSNQTFKVSLVNSSSNIHSESLQRLPLSSISTPRNTEVTSTATVSSDDTSVSV